MKADEEVKTGKSTTPSTAPLNLLAFLTASLRSKQAHMEMLSAYMVYKEKKVKHTHSQSHTDNQTTIQDLIKSTNDVRNKYRLEQLSVNEKIEQLKAKHRENRKTLNQFLMSFICGN